MALGWNRRAEGLSLSKKGHRYSPANSAMYRDRSYPAVDKRLQPIEFCRIDVPLRRLCFSRVEEILGLGVFMYRLL
jgi:hypothetical protein